MLENTNYYVDMLESITQKMTTPLESMALTNLFPGGLLGVLPL
jgi:hypothetical protein